MQINELNEKQYINKNKEIKPKGVILNVYRKVHCGSYSAQTIIKEIGLHIITKIIFMCEGWIQPWVHEDGKRCHKGK